MTLHLYAPPPDWPATYCNRGQAWHEPVPAVYPVDLELVDCTDCLEALRLEKIHIMELRQLFAAS